MDESAAASELQPAMAPQAGAEPASALPPRIILNPAGAAGKARRLHRLLQTTLGEGSAEIVLTSGSGHAERLAREAASAGRDIIAVGGDGTVAEAANGILTSGQRVALGIVPCGTGNDYAFHVVRLPREPREALGIALAGTPRLFDVGQVNGRYFLNALGVGIDANIAAAAERLKRYPLMRGQTLYWAASLTELVFHYDRCPQLAVTVDDAQPMSRDFALAAVSIGPTYGGGFRINPDADPHDGLFDLCTIWKPSQLRALRLLPMIEKGRHLNEPEVSRMRVRSVTLEAARPIHAHLDGEVITASRFAARIVPGALLVRQ